jgi:phage minor structural protein
MLIITDVFGNTEALTDFQNVEVIEEVNGDFSLSFTCFLTEKNEQSFHLVQEESIVELDGLEFRIKKMVETRNRKIVSLAKHVFFELIDNPVYGINGGILTLNDAVAFTLSGSGWTFENLDVEESKWIPNFGEDNSLSLVKKICEEFGCEYKIEPDRHLKFSKEIGTDQDFQFRYKHNIKTLSRTVDTTKFATVLKGFGADGLEVEYRSPNADIYGEKHGEPLRDDRYTNSENLLKKLEETIQDVPEVSIELEVVQLGFDAQLGDKVWLIYEPLRIEFQTRVMAYKYYPFQKRSPSVVLSNKKKTITNLVAKTRSELKEAKKETRSKIDQTKEKISLEVERLDGEISEAKSSITITADEIRSEVSSEIQRVDGNIESVSSSITQTSEKIDLEVNRLDESIASINLEADSIQLSVSSLGSRIGSAESTITQTASEIESKVSQEDFNGATVMSLIEQTPEEIKFSANKISMEGITHVNGNLEIGKGWEPGGDNGQKSITFSNAGKIIYADGFLYQSTTFGHQFAGNVKVHSGYELDLTGVTVKGLNVVVSFG